MSSPLDKFLSKLNAFLTNESNIDEMKEDLWKELSEIYYKYEDDDQKKAFREVMKDITDELKNGNWKTIYGKLYKIEKDRK